MLLPLLGSAAVGETFTGLIMLTAVPLTVDYSIRHRGLAGKRQEESEFFLHVSFSKEAHMKCLRLSVLIDSPRLYLSILVSKYIVPIRVLYLPILPRGELLFGDGCRSPRIRRRGKHKPTLHLRLRSSSWLRRWRFPCAQFYGGQAGTSQAQVRILGDNSGLALDTVKLNRYLQKGLAGVTSPQQLTDLKRSLIAVANFYKPQVAAVAGSIANAFRTQLCACMGIAAVRLRYWLDCSSGRGIRRRGKMCSEGIIYNRRRQSSMYGGHAFINIATATSHGPLPVHLRAPYLRQTGATQPVHHAPKHLA